MSSKFVSNGPITAGVNIIISPLSSDYTLHTDRD